MALLYEKIWKDKDGIWKGQQTNGAVDHLTESWLNIYLAQLKEAMNAAYAALRDIRKTK